MFCKSKSRSRCVVWPLILLWSIIQASANNFLTKDSSSDKGSMSRSLALMPISHFNNQSVFTATSGIHPSRICNSFKPYENQYFCMLQDEPIPYVSLPPHLLDSEDYHGILMECPETKEGCNDIILNDSDMSLRSCQLSCGNTIPAGGMCNELTRCELGSYCKRTKGSMGACAPCPLVSDECLAEPDYFSMTRCLECKLKCEYHYWGDLSIGEEIFWASAFSSFRLETVKGEVYAPLQNCTILVDPFEKTCPGANGSICLIHNYLNRAYFEMAKKCEIAGGLAAVFYESSDEYPDNVPGMKTLNTPLNIPVISVSYNDGMALQETKLGSMANVSTYDAGNTCSYNKYCSLSVPCIGPNAYGVNEYCIFHEDLDIEEGVQCESCPDNPIGCFTPLRADELVDPRQTASCATTCLPKLEFGKTCATCGDIEGFEFGIDDPADKCVFCPKNDLHYPDRIVPFLSVGEGEVTCWQVDFFFQMFPIHKDSGYCQLSQQQNYVCGCEGLGYAGANTKRKQNALVWMPRVSAILSIMGSTFIIFDVSRDRSTRRELYQQIMICMSVFDILGSTAYAFTSAPIPSKYYYQGARGDDATCTAQGFFIQAGTVAGYANVALAFYYFLSITKNVNDASLKAHRHWFIGCPIVVGLTFAFAGLPYYDNVFLWCNNTALWWPDIPIGAAILIATVIMGIVCFDVHKKVQAFKRELQQGATNGRTLSTKVFWQSFWYLMGFYMTWPAYLALQFFWTYGKAYSHYGFILYAGTVVPMQGVWNCFNYIRTRRKVRVTARSTQQETRYTTVGPNTATEYQVANGSLLEDNDDELLTFFSNPIDVEYDDENWVTSNASVPVLPSFYPLLKSSISIPNGSAKLISERIKQLLRNRSIAAVYDSYGAKADCTSKNNVNFRIRLYRERDVESDDTDDIIVEIQRRDGFDVKFQQDMSAIFDAAEGKEADPMLDEDVIPAISSPENDLNSYTQSSLRRISSILCPVDEAVTTRGIEFALSALLPLTNIKESGHTATLISKDLLNSRQFEALRDVMVSYACSPNQDANCAKLKALEVLANAMHCSGISPVSDAPSLTPRLRLHLIDLIENAAANPRAADLACLIFKYAAIEDWNDEESSRLDDALMEANRYGHEAFADLEEHSQECMSLASRIVS